MAIQLEPGFEGPYNAGYYDVILNGKKFRIRGKEASLISMLLSGYNCREDFHPFDAFTMQELAENSVSMKVVEKQ
jgi:hypothetical protein